ncbi:MAG: phosphate acyltransferase, partial [Nanoarchaeota archaeon]
MEQFVESMRKRASGLNSIIILPEATDQRILKAADFLFHNKLATPILIGSQPEIAGAANSCGANISELQIRDPLHDVETQNFAQTLFQLRQHKGMTIEQVSELIKDPVYFGTMMVKQ